MTIANKLLALDQIRRDIRASLVAKGVTVPAGTLFAQYGTKISEISGGSPDDDSDTWQRPTDWLSVPTPLVNELYILVAVYPDQETRLISDIIPVSGTLVTDWGDGTTETTSGQRTKIYTYNDLPAESYSTRGYRQALIKVTAESGISTVDLNRLTAGLASATATVLEIKGNLPTCTSLTLTNNSPLAGQTLPLLEHVDLELGDLSTLKIAIMFSIQQLRLRVASINTGSVTASSLFSGLYNVKTIDINSATIFNGVTVATSLFQDCYNLRSITFEPNSFNQLTSVNSMFRNCHRLKTCVFGTNSLILCNTFSSMFLNCYSLQEFTFPTGSLTRSSTTFSSTFLNCSNLETVNFPAGTMQFVNSMLNTFQNCVSLQSITFPASAFTVSNVSLSNAFNGCQNLETITILSTPRINNLTSAFNLCKRLKTISMSPHPTIFVTSAASAFLECSSLSSIIGLRPNVNIMLADNMLSAAALNTIYTNLPTVTSRTITVAGNYGTDDPAHNPIIATAKGWSVVV